MTISVSTIPSNLLKPGQYSELNTLSGLKGLPANTQKLLLIGQMTAAATVAAAVPTQVFSPAEAAAYFGPGSILHRQALAAFGVNRNLTLWMVGQADGAGTAATGTVVFTGTATGAGSFVLLVGDDRVEVPFAVAQTAAGMATAAIAAINANTSLPVTATAATGTVTITAKNKGTVGNQIALTGAISGAGLTQVTAAALTAGATDPTLQTTLDAIFPGQFHIINYWSPLQADLTSLAAHLVSVSSSLEQRPGRGIVAALPQSILSAVVTLATTTNCERLTLPYLRGSISPAYEIGASVAAAVASEENPARPLDGVLLPGVTMPVTSSLLSRTEQETLLAAGVTPLEASGQFVSIVRLVTTRTVTNGATDLTLLDSATIATLDYLRFAWNTRQKILFQQMALNDRVLSAIREAAVSLCLELQDAELLQHVGDYKAQFIAERDPNYPGRARVSIPAPIVPGLHQTYTRIDLLVL